MAFMRKSQSQSSGLIFMTEFFCRHGSIIQLQSIVALEAKLQGEGHRSASNHIAVRWSFNQQILGKHSSGTVLLNIMEFAPQVTVGPRC